MYLALIKLLDWICGNKKSKKAKNLTQSIGQNDPVNEISNQNHFKNKTSLDKGIDNFGLKCKHKVHVINSKLGRLKGSYIQAIHVPKRDLHELALADRITVRARFCEMDRELECMLDNGAAANLMTDTVLNHIRKESGLNLPLQKINISLSDHNDGKIDVVGGIQLPMQIGDAQFNPVFCVSRDDNFRILLGMPMQKYHGLNPIVGKDGLKLYLADKDQFVQCRKFFDLARKVEVETTSVLQIEPKQALMVQAICSEANGQRTNLDGRKALFTPEISFGKDKQLVTVLRKGKFAVSVINETNCPVKLAPGYPLGKIEMVNFDEYKKIEAGEIFDIMDDFKQIPRRQIEKCFCQCRQKNLVFRLDKDSHEVYEFANMIGLNGGLKKMQLGTGNQLMPFMRANKIAGVHMWSKSERLDEKFAGSTASIVVKNINHIGDLNEIDFIMKFIRKNPEVKFEILMPKPCRTHSVEKLDNYNLVNICLVSGIYGYEAKPFDGPDEYFQISLLKNVFVVMRKIMEGKINIYIHFPSDKLKETRTMFHVFSSLFSKFEFAIGTNLQLRMNNLRSGTFENYPGYDSWKKVLENQQLKFKLLDEAEVSHTKVEPKYIVVDETAISDMSKSIDLDGCTCLVCLHKIKQKGKWIKVARYNIVDRQMGGDKDEGEIDEKGRIRFHTLDAVNSAMINEIQKYSFFCDSARPKWVKSSEYAGTLCQHSHIKKDMADVKSLYFTYPPSGHQEEKDDVSVAGPGSDCGYCEDRLRDVEEGKEDLKLPVESGDDRVGRIQNVESPDVSSQIIPDVSKTGQPFLDEITPSQRLEFDKMSVMSEADVGRLMEKQEIEINVNIETAQEELPTDWREVFDISTVPEFARERITKLLDKYKHILSLHKGMRGKLKTGYEAEFITEDEKPIRTKNYPQHPSLLAFQEHLINHMIKTGLISEQSGSHVWLSPVFLVHRNSAIKEKLRKGEMKLADLELNLETMRLVIDFSRLNKCLINKGSDASVTTRELCNSMANFKYVTGSDISGAYKSIPIKESSKHKCAFEFGGKQYVFNYICEGAANAVRIFNQVFAGILKRSQMHEMHNHPYSKQLEKMTGKQAPGSDIEESGIKKMPDGKLIDEKTGLEIAGRMTGSSVVMFYVDDVFVVTYKNAKDPIEDHFIAIENYFMDISESGLLLAAKKFVFFESKSIVCLGFECSPDNYCPIKDRFDLFSNYPTPVTKHDLYRYLGSVCYCMNFVPGLNLKLDKLFQALHRTKLKHGKVNLTPEEVELFQEVNKRMAHPQKLHYMRLDLPLELCCDSSRRGVGAVLRQEVEPDVFVPLLYYSKLFSRSLQISNCAYEHEILGLMTCVTAKPVLYYLMASVLPITIVMDNMAAVATLAALQSGKNQKITRWAHCIYSSPFKFNLKHCSNKTGFMLPDLLSRVSEIFTKDPLPVREDFTKLRKSQIHMPDFGDRKLIPFDEIRKMLNDKPEIVDNIIDYRRIDDDVIHRNKLKQMIVGKKGDQKAVLKQQVAPSVKKIVNTNPQEENSKAEIGDIYAAYSTLNKESIIKDQARDPYTSAIIADILLHGTSKINNRFRVLNGTLLVRILNKKFTANPENYQIVLGFAMTCTVMGLLHSITHCGARRAIKLFARYFYSKDAYAVAAEIALSCRVCARHNRLTGIKDCPTRGIVTRTQNTLVIDHCHVGGPREVKRMTGFLNIVDSATGYSMARMVKSTGGEESITAVRDALNLCAGRVRLLMSDGAVGLASHKKMIELCKSYQTKTSVGVPYTIGGRAVVESSNKQILNLIDKLSIMLNKPWTDVFGPALVAYNYLPGGLFGESIRSKREMFFKCTDQSPFSLSNMLALEHNPKLYDRVSKSINRLIDKATHKIRVEQAEIQREFEAKEFTKKIKVGSLVYVQKLPEKNVHKTEDKYRPSIYQVVARKNFLLFVVPIVEGHGNIALEVSIKNCKPFSPRLSKVYLHLPNQLQNLLGQQLSLSDVIEAKRLGILLPDFDETYADNSFPIDATMSEESSSDSDTDLDEAEHNPIRKNLDQYKNDREYVKYSDLKKTPGNSERMGSTHTVAGRVKSTQINESEGHADQHFDTKSGFDIFVEKVKAGARALRDKLSRREDRLKKIL